MDDKVQELLNKANSEISDLIAKALVLEMIMVGLAGVIESASAELPFDPDGSPCPYCHPGVEGVCPDITCKYFVVVGEDGQG